MLTDETDDFLPYADNSSASSALQSVADRTRLLEWNDPGSNSDAAFSRTLSLLYFPLQNDADAGTILYILFKVYVCPDARVKAMRVALEED